MRAPDGITKRHEREGGRANVLPLVLLASLMGAGLFGVYGGLPHEPRKVSSAEADLSIHMPTTLRDGMLFETVIEVKARQPVDDLVIGVSDNLWRDFTINTMIPAAGDETYKDGLHRFSFGKAEAGQVLRFKIDGQINPSLHSDNRGHIAVFDGERQITALPVRIKVLP